MLMSITISVRRLVEFLLRSGSIDNRTGGSGEEVMLAGSRMHRELQRAQPEGYEAEVPLRIAWVFEKRLADGSAAPEDGLPSHKPLLDDVEVIVEGRADGIYCDHGGHSGGKGKRHPKRRGTKQEKGTGENAGEEKTAVWTIDEIKTTYRRLSRMRRPEPVHLAQAKCYAFLYAAQHDLERINVRMTYCNLYSGEIRYFYEEETREELTTWFSALMEEYRKWAEYMLLWQVRRTASIRKLAFPYPYRKGQKELAAGVYSTISHSRKLFLEAPTGTGKTLATLYPSLKAMGQGLAEKIFYLTAKTITRTAASATLEQLRADGLLCKSVIVTARDKICPLHKPDCNPEKCPRARGHYDRVNQALFSILTKLDNYDKAAIERYAEAYQVCPYAMSLDLCQFSDVIIGDYNYLFDLNAWLRRLFPEGEGRKPYVFLIDEAHNLLDRGRDMYSAALTREEVLAFQKEVADLYPALSTRLSAVNRVFRHLETEQEQEGTSADCRELTEIDQLSQKTGEAQEELESILAEERIALQNGHARRDPLYREKEAIHEDLLAFYFNLANFNSIAATLDNHYIVYSGQHENTGYYQVRLLCVDPSERLRTCMNRGRASVLFSATLLPIQYYKGLLGGTGDDYEIYAHSVFDPEKLGLFLIRDVTSRYKERNLQQYEKLADCIHNLTGERHGNYMVFCPSYSFMNNVADCYEDKYLGGRRTELMVSSGRKPSTAGQTAEGAAQEGQLDFTSWEVFSDAQDTGLATAEAFGHTTLPTDHTVPGSEIRVLRQAARMTEEQREAFLHHFRTVRNDRSLIGFCVLGGIFGEGIDLRKDALIGAIIIGTGLPMVCTERELFRRYFDRKGENGFDYAYTYPGMNKVLQAAGRVIRTQEDVGFVALLDDRFTKPSYRALFPAEWKEIQETSVRECRHLVEKFWNEWL